MPAIPLIAYADLEHDPLVAALRGAAGGDEEAGVVAARILFAEPGGAVRALTRRVVGSTGPFAGLAAAGRAGFGHMEAAGSELGALRGWAEAVADGPGASPGEDTPPGEAPAATRMRRRLERAGDWNGMAEELAAFHRAHGTGDLALFRVLRFGEGGLVGVERPDPIAPGDLLGPTSDREVAGETMRAFAAGAPAVDVLLYGPPGTGKSATVRALANGLADAGLRLVQVDREATSRLGELLALLDDGPRTVVLLDDAVFDGAERGDRALRAALEGDVAHRPPNVAVWATSNRMRLIEETHRDREDDVEGALGRGERAALATRFGLRVHLGDMGMEDFVTMAMELARRAGADEEGLRAAAVRHARDQGLTPRSAHHFAALRAPRDGRG